MAPFAVLSREERVRRATEPRGERNDRSWRAEAECAKPEHDSEAWFPVGNTGPAMLLIQDAKDICNHRCPVVEQCAAFALRTGMPDGVWGGMSEEDRKTVKRRAARRRLREGS